jgi:hypothetical protein
MGSHIGVDPTACPAEQIVTVDILGPLGGRCTILPSNGRSIRVETFSELVTYLEKLGASREQVLKVLDELRSQRQATLTIANG